MARAMKDSGVAWIGEIPEEWGVRRLKYCAIFVQEKYSDTYGELNYIGLENVESWSGKLVQTESEYDRSQSIVFHEDDIIWGKLRPYLAKVFHCRETGCCSGEFGVIRINHQYAVRYFWNLLISSGFVTVVDSSTYGTKMPRANIEYIKNVEIPIPPYHEQSCIAAFLDRRCTEIDRLIAATRRTIDEYKKLKQSIITEAVTHGVRGPRKMKDSGVEWIGEIPEDWDSVSFKKVVLLTIDNRGRTPEINSIDEGIPLLEVSSLGNKYPDISRIKKYISQESHDRFIRNDLMSGDILVATVGATVGKSSIVPEKFDYCIAQNLVGYRLKADQVPLFWYYYFQSSAFLFMFLQYDKGNTINNIKISDMERGKVVYPSYMEQIQIANYLDEKCKVIDELIAQKDMIVTELESYKKAIIYEYVTGKKGA